MPPKKRGKSRLARLRNDKLKRERGAVLLFACPQCQCELTLKGKGYACFSGKCEKCNIEIEHVSLGPGVGTFEIYPVKIKRVEKPPEPIEIKNAPAEPPLDEGDKWFGDIQPPKLPRKKGKRP